MSLSKAVMTAYKATLCVNNIIKKENNEVAKYHIYITRSSVDAYVSAEYE